MGLIFRQLERTGAGQIPQIVPFPEIPHMVVMVHMVRISLSTVPAASAIVNILDHNTDLSITVQTNDSPTMWAKIVHTFNTDPNSVPPIHYTPPYELVGRQRWVMLMSTGTVRAELLVHYTLRREPSLTLWTALRKRTSIEKG